MSSDSMYRMRVRRQSTVPVTVPLIVGLTIGGALLFTWLAILVIILVKWKYRRIKAKLKDSEAANTAKQADIPLRKVRYPEMEPSERSSMNPFLPNQRVANALPKEWLEDDSMIDSPPTSKAKARRLSQKGIFQISGMRDSWPLSGSMQNVSLRLIQPNNSLVTLNQVGGGGYVLPLAPKRPGRTHARKTSNTKIIVSLDDSHLQRFSTIVSDRPAAPSRPRHHRRSASENQLSTILRSTSQRLKAVHRKSLSRTLTTLGQPSGPPPENRLTTPRKPGSESREGLTETDDIETVASSICDPSPSPTRKKARSSGIGSIKRRTLDTLSIESIESLCGGTTPDHVIPSPLRSPDKKFAESPQQHTIRISPVVAKDLSDVFDRAGRASILELGGDRSAEEKAASTSPHRISIASDPFYSSVKSGKRALPQNRIVGPRPQYIHHRTFGHEATAERPASFVSTSSSPLRHISGNAQTPPRPDSSASQNVTESKPNPFRWEPQETIATMAARAAPKTKGHKRSHLVGVSLIPRPPSVCPVPEEEEDLTPLRFSIPLNAPMRTYDPTKSPSPKPSSTSSFGLSSRPPSISTFNPVLSNPKLVQNIRVPADNSPTLGYDNSLQIYSPTLAVSNYYSEGRTSEEDFFNQKPARPLPLPRVKSPPKHSLAHLPHPELKDTFTFPSLAINAKDNPQVSLPAVPTATTAASTTSSFFTSSPIFPAPPVLAQPPPPSPSHLTGPRIEPSKQPTSTHSSTVSLPRDSLLHHSICLLRRMNSEISRCSTISGSSADVAEGRGSPRASLRPSPSPELTPSRLRKERQSRSSHAYLMMGTPSSRKSRVSKRQSTRDRGVENSRIKEEDEGGLQDWERKGLASVRPRRSGSPAPDLTAADVKQEPVSPLPYVPNAPDLSARAQEFPPRNDSLKTGLVTPPSPPHGLALKTVRWSDATPSPSIRVIRHESQLLEPVPQGLPAWGKGKGKGKQDVESLEDVKENVVVGGDKKRIDYGNWNGNYGRPDSLGLYDDEGFLKASLPKPSGFDLL